MTGKVTDEMLMAFVDGETDEATAAMIARALAADADLAARAEKFRVSRALIREAFGDARREPVPEALVEAALRGRKGAVALFPRREMLKFALPLAACLALVFSVAGYLAGQGGSGPAADPLGRSAIAAALGGTKAGESRSVAVAGQEARFETLATYRVEGGLCRRFDLTGVEIALSGVGCDRGAGWAVELTAAGTGGDGTYAPASGAALESIDAYLDALEASAPLSAEEEAKPEGL